MTELCADTTVQQHCSDVGATRCSIRQPASSPTETEKQKRIYQKAQKQWNIYKNVQHWKVDGASHEAHCCFDLWCISCQGALSCIILWVEHQIRSDRIFWRCRKWCVLRNRGNGSLEGLRAHPRCNALRKSPHAVWLTEPRNVWTLSHEQTNHSAACGRTASFTKWTNHFRRSGGRWSLRAHTDSRALRATKSDDWKRNSLWQVTQMNSSR